MKRKILFTLFLLLFCIIAGLTYTAYRYYTPPCIKEPYQMMNHGDTLRIAYIGDSWAFFHRDHKCQIPMMLEETLHRPIKVHSYGIGGKTSKEIYECIYNHTDFRQFFEKRGYKYCFISAGINDTYKKMGTNYYKKSMDGIIQLFLYNHIHPIILEIPDYDIQRGYDYQQTNRKMIRQFSMFLNNTSLDCKQQFRDAFDELVNTKGYHNVISIVRYKTWNNNYQNDLQQLYVSDGMHLNDKGYETLDSVIANEILTIERSNVPLKE